MKYIDVTTALGDLPSNPTWPTIVEAIARVAVWTQTEAEARLLGALADGLVIATFADDCEWTIRLAAERGTVGTTVPSLPSRLPPKEE